MSGRAKGSHYSEGWMMMMTEDEDVLGSILGNSWGEESFIPQFYLNGARSLWASFTNSVVWSSSRIA